IRDRNVTGVQTCALPISIAISPTLLPDLPQKEFDAIAHAKTLAEIRGGPVKYRKVKELKLKLLRAWFENFLCRHKDDKESASFEIGRASCREKGRYVSEV